MVPLRSTYEHDCITITLFDDRKHFLCVCFHILPYVFNCFTHDIGIGVHVRLVTDLVDDVVVATIFYELANLTEEILSVTVVVIIRVSWFQDVPVYDTVHVLFLTPVDAILHPLFVATLISVV